MQKYYSYNTENNGLNLNYQSVCTGEILYLIFCPYSRVATVREKVLENENFPDRGKVRELHFQSGKFKKNEKVMEKSGNFIFS